MILTPDTLPAQVAALSTLAQGPVSYDAQLSLVDLAGNVLDDLTGHLVKDGQAAVSRDCTALLHGSLRATLDAELVWGRDMVQPSLLVQRAGAADWYRFPLGVYVVTSPQKDLKPNDPREVTGYDKLYLLNNEISDSFNAAPGSSYSDNIQTLFELAGLLPSDHSGDLADVLTYSGSWADKVLPVVMAYPLASPVPTYLSIINEMLKASGCLPLYTSPDGRFNATTIPVPATQGIDWTFVGDNPDPALIEVGVSVVSPTTRNITSDVYNVPNEFVFVQNGLTFQPTANDGSDGRYVVENVSQPPSDQTTVGRVLRQTQFLNASGMADLIAQGDQIVTQLLSQAEKVTFDTAPWPAAWHYNVFRYSEGELPRVNQRKLQAQRWSLPLDGRWMSWASVAVADE